MTRKLESNEYCEIACQVRYKTDRAVLIHDGAREVWIPRSLIEDPDPEDMEIGQHIILINHEPGGFSDGNCQNCIRCPRCLVD